LRAVRGDLLATGPNKSTVFIKKKTSSTGWFGKQVCKNITTQNNVKLSMIKPTIIFASVQQRMTAVICGVIR